MFYVSIVLKNSTNFKKNNQEKVNILIHIIAENPWIKT